MIRTLYICVPVLTIFLLTYLRGYPEGISFHGIFCVTCTSSWTLYYFFLQLLFLLFWKEITLFFFFSKNKWRQLVVNFKMFLIYTLTFLFALRLRTLEGVSNSCWCLGVDLASCTQWTLGHFFAPPPSPLHSPLFLCLISCALYFSVLFIENFSWIGILDLLIKFPCPLIFLSWVFNLKRRPLDWGVF